MNLDQVQVYLRLRPVLSSESSTKVVEVESSKNIRVSKGFYRYKMKFQSVIEASETQETTFEQVKPAIDYFLSGKNTTVLAYGQTSAGKTHTIIGQEDPGIIPRALSYIYSQLKGSFSTFESFLEIYQDRVYDLFGKPNKELNVGEDETGRVVVKDLTQLRVTSESQALEHFTEGLKQRRVRATQWNMQSSRSHCVFQVYLLKNDVLSKLSIVDLAGSEKFKPSKEADHKQALNEMKAINKSLSVLGQCISMMNKKKKGFVPFRNSKLTRVLKDSLYGNSQVILFGCVSPSVSCVEETISTLQFLERAKKLVYVDNQSKSQKYLKEKEQIAHLDLETKVKEYEKEIFALKNENKKLKKEVKKKNNLENLLNDENFLLDYVKSPFEVSEHSVEEGKLGRENSKSSYAIVKQIMEKLGTKTKSSKDITHKYWDEYVKTSNLH
mmetsp:Transcript_15878/g.23008  ORF Transcript_15878/g.23008 Transcript_15878/m.23008 type:complete len:440 (+) Transcript_15878:26-1345(+)